MIKTKGILVFVLLIGWVLNIMKLSNLDFVPPYKAEFFRAVGLYLPFGGVIGWLTIGEENDSEEKSIR